MRIPVGCSPAVLRGPSRAITANEMAMYPEYQVTTRRLARYFGVRPAEDAPDETAIDDGLALDRRIPSSKMAIRF